MLERNPPISDRLYVSNTCIEKFHVSQAVLELQAVAALTISEDTGQHEHHLRHGKVDANAVSSAFAKRKLISACHRDVKTRVSGWFRLWDHVPIHARFSKPALRIKSLMIGENVLISEQ